MPGVGERTTSRNPGRSGAFPEPELLAELAGAVGGGLAEVELAAAVVGQQAERDVGAADHVDGRPGAPRHLELALEVAHLDLQVGPVHRVGGARMVSPGSSQSSTGSTSTNQPG